jgi:carbamoylphosphate synthase large subunit
MVSMEEILSACERFGPIHLMIPYTPDQSIFLATHYDEIRPHVKCLLVSRDKAAIEILNNKRWFIEHMREQNLQHVIPVSYVSSQELPEQFVTNPQSLPCVVKRTVSYGGSGTFILKERDVLAMAVEKLRQGTHIIQEFVDEKTEWAFHAIVENGEILAWASVRHVFEDTYFVNGQSDRKKTVLLPPPNGMKIIQQFQTILQTLNYTGICCFDYKIVHGEIKLFEINPRIGASLLVLNRAELIRFLQTYLIH